MYPSLDKLTQHFKDDMSAALGLALVVLPLSLGISIASSAPPMAGVISAIVGGLVATFFRGSHITVNGPSAGLIAVMLSGILALGNGDLTIGFGCLLAATVIAGILQMLMGLLRLGEIGDMVPAASIHGMLAAVGIIIFSTQIHITLGVQVPSNSAFESLKLIPQSIFHLNPFITIISLIVIIVLVLHHKIKNEYAQLIPPPIWILVFTIPLVYGFNFFENHSLNFLGQFYNIGPEYLVSIPSNVLQNLHTPIWDKIQTPIFWLVVFSITIISTIETLVSTKIVDKIDSLNRQSNLNKELFAVGLSTSLSGLIGGLPVITAIPVYSGAKTKWSNFYYGIILLILVLFCAPFIQKIPLAALAVLLVYTGYKLAAPKVLIETYRKGDDQFLIFLTTLFASLSQGFLVGILVGIITTLFNHFVKSNLEFKQFLKYLTEPSISTNRTENSHELYIRLKGVVNFINIPKLKRVMRLAANEKYIVLDMSHARLIDYTVLEYLHDDVDYDILNVKLEIIGLETHDASSRHPNATRILPEDKKPQLNKRQQDLELLSHEHSGEFWPETRWNMNLFKDFNFFKTRNIEYTLNTAKGNYKLFFEWETCDITFEEGGLFAKERHTSVSLLYLPFNAPIFVLQQEAFLDKIGIKLNLQSEDINFYEHPEFSDTFLLQGPDPSSVRDFFNPKLIQYLEKHPYYHIESNGSVILIFKEMRFSSPSEMANMHRFSLGLSDILLASWKEQTMKIDALI